MTDPEMVAAKGVPQSMLLEKAAESLQSVMNANCRSSSEGDDEDDASDMDMDLVIPTPSAIVDARKYTEGMELFHSALHLRQAILSLKNTLPSVPTAEDLSHDDSSVPAVYNFLAWVLTGVNDDTKITLEEKVNVGNEEVHRHVMSIAQDIVHAGSHG